MTAASRIYPRPSFVRRYPALVLGLGFLLAIILPILIGHLVIDTSKSAVLSATPTLPPSAEHPLGTQSEGRDVLALLIVSTPSTLVIGLIGGGVSLLVGTLLGLIAGYVGGRVDTLILGAVDVGLTIPALAILIMIAASFPVVTLPMMGLVVASTSWMHPTRVIRSQVLSLRERGFVRFARLSGASSLYIIFYELLPNLIPFLAASFVNSVSTAILASIGLEVLGLGSQQIQTLGTTIYYAIFYSAMWRGLWWWWLPPIIILIFIFMGLFFLSMALDELANPRMKRA